MLQSGAVSRPSIARSTFATRLAALANLGALAVLSTGCSAAELPKKGPLGYLPTAITSAQPEWIPFTVRAGTACEHDKRERHLVELRQLTSGGKNSGARFSPDGRSMVFQSTREGVVGAQVYVMALGSGDTTRVSKGEGRATGGSFAFPQGERILYASTSGGEAATAAKRSQESLLPLEDTALFTSKLDGTERRLLLGGKAYDADAAVASDGSRLVFTSTRDGDLELYTARLDGSDVRRITFAPGYDGGATFSPDVTKLTWQAGRPVDKSLDEYRELLGKHLVHRTGLEIAVGGASGQNPRFVTKNGKSNVAPAFLPDSRRVIFASDLDSVASPDAPPSLALYVVDPDGPLTASGTPVAARVTFQEGSDGSPAFSPDGKYLVFSSSRLAKAPGETNLFIARWVD